MPGVSDVPLMMASFVAVWAWPASARTASFVASPVFQLSNSSFTPLGKVISGRSAPVVLLALGEAADAVAPESAPAILSFPFELSSPLPQAVSRSAAVAANAAATGKERRFTVDSP